VSASSRRPPDVAAPDAAAQPLPPAVEAALEPLDALVELFQRHPDPAVQARAVALLQCVDALHRSGLRRLAELLQVAGLRRRALDDPEVRLLFDLYDLDEDGERVRADAVLAATVRPYVESHGGRLEVVAAEAGVVTVRLSGACHGCAGSAATLRHLVEQSLREAMPDFVRLDVAEPAPPTPGSFIPIASIAERPRLVWHAAAAAADVPAAGMLGIEVAGEPVLLVDAGGELYAYRDACPGTPFPVRGGRVENGAVVCPWHGCRFAVRGGKRLDREGAGLGVVPIAVEDGLVRIGVLGRAERTDA
jgi:nitrite reductase/ring-hydroxylating ferredoxin subunit/Fe-S cluster biogenesis protein NfuA